MENVNNLNGVPLWGHGTMENLEAGITPVIDQNEEETESTEGGESDEGVQEGNASLEPGSEGEVEETGDSDSPEQ